MFDKSNRAKETIKLEGTPPDLLQELLHFCYEPILPQLTEEELMDLRRLNENYAVHNLTEVIGQRLEEMNKCRSNIRYQPIL